MVNPGKVCIYKDYVISHLFLRVNGDKSYQVKIEGYFTTKVNQWPKFIKLMFGFFLG